MIRSNSASDRALKCFVVVCSVFVFIVTFYPMYYVLIASFSDYGALTNGKVWLWPVKPSIAGYNRLFEQQSLWQAYGNTIFYTVCSTCLTLAVTIPAAYSMSRRNLMLKPVITVYFVITMYFGGGLIPTYMVMKNLGLINNPLVMIVPGCMSVWYMILARTFFQNTLPEELHEAAMLDGCSEGRYFLTIAVPLSPAIMAVIALYCMVGAWNSYYNALVYLIDYDKMPLQIVLRDILMSDSLNIRQSSTANLGEEAQARYKELVKYCVIVVSTVPILAVYPFLQKYLVKGVMIGSVKG